MDHCLGFADLLDKVNVGEDDCAAERNDTSLALQITLTDEDGRDGHVLPLGEPLRPVTENPSRNG